MLALHLQFEDGHQDTLQSSLPLDIGRAPDCGLRLGGWRVARRHARIVSSPDGVFIEDFGSLSGTLVNGKRVTRYGSLQINDEIIIGPCLISVQGLPASGTGANKSKLKDQDNLIGVRDEFKEEFASSPGALPEWTPGEPPENQGSLLVHRHLERRRLGAKVQDEQARAPDSQVNDKVGRPPNVSVTNVLGDSAHGATDTSDLDLLLQHKRRLHAALLEALDLRRSDVSSMSDQALRSEARRVLSELIRHDTQLPATVDQSKLLEEVVNEAVGLGPLEPLLADPTISEIMVNRHDEIFIERHGRLMRHASGFSSEQAVLGVIERIVSPLGRRIDESSPMVDARLRDGSRVNAIIAPIALRGASMTIRKFPARRLGMDDLLRVGALDQAMATFLQACVAGKKNIVVSGGTGSGKTTLLNILSNCIPEGERVVTIEDAAELRLDHGHLVTLEARPANLEGRGKIEIRDLVRNALRMRPDRIVVGECRGGEAFDMLAAMNTGHEGSLTTLHANTPRDALSRLETMILMAGMDLPLAAVREHIAAAIDVLVQQVRTSDGRRLISSIVEVSGIESGRIQIQPLFQYEATERAFVGCGVMPDFVNVGATPAFAGVTAELFSRQTVCASSTLAIEEDV